MEVMAAPRKYPDEVRERAIRLVRDLVDSGEDGVTVTGACRRVGEQLGINTDTLRDRIKPVLVDDGEQPGLSTSESAPLAALERETASAFFPADASRSPEVDFHTASAAAAGASSTLAVVPARPAEVFTLTVRSIVSRS
jgi:transposase